MATYNAAKEIFSRAFPSQVFRPQAPTEWRGEFPLPDLVAEYFLELGPVDVSLRGYGNDYFLPSLSRLWDCQAGYRYHSSTRKRLSGWDEHWLVIACEGADAFIFSRASGAILHVCHGTGAWRPDKMFGSLAEMASTFAIIGEIAETAGMALVDDDAMILPHYRDEARARIVEFLGSPAEADALLKGLGWG